jgi:hypothetical protein
MERESRYWFVGLAGKRENILFKKGMQQLWDWAKPAKFIRLLTDGEYRYSKEGDWGKIPPAHFRNYLCPLAHVFLKPDEVSSTYRHRKVWRQGLEVACKVKGSQGTPRRVWRYRNTVRIAHIPCTQPPPAPQFWGGEIQNLGTFPPRIGGVGGPVQ